MIEGHGYLPPLPPPPPQLQHQLTPSARPYRRRINTERKAKVVAAVWGTEFIQFLAALAIWH